MALLALGLNHHTAPVNVRERVAIGDERLNAALLTLRNVDAVNEAAIISTCNRTEIYCGVRDQDASPIIEWFHRHHHSDLGSFEPYLFQHADQAVVSHLMRVCSGLDSMVLGEPQILGQIKRAYRGASDAGTLGTELSALFQTAFSVAKKVRTDTAIGSSPVSIAFAAVSLARQIFEGFSEHTALLIGAGETIQLAARHLQGAGIGQINIANRTVQRAATLADEVNGTALSLSDIPNALPSADIIISATGSPLPILGKGAVEQALRTRRYRPMLIVDIAVPRDVESEVGNIDGVFLYTVDDLQQVIDENRQSRQVAAAEAEEIVRNQVELFMRRMQALGANDTIRAYRDTMDELRNGLLLKARKQLRLGQDPETVLQQFAHSLGNKVMHGPTRRLRDAAEQGDQAFIENARTLLDLPRKPS
ncbi:MAG: glutamyl-tRNA reductase [Granulosicoccus sp.]